MYNTALDSKHLNHFTLKLPSEDRLNRLENQKASIFISLNLMKGLPVEKIIKQLLTDDLKTKNENVILNQWGCHKNSIHCQKELIEQIEVDLAQ